MKLLIFKQKKHRYFQPKNSKFKLKALHKKVPTKNPKLKKLPAKYGAPFFSDGCTTKLPLSKLFY